MVYSHTGYDAASYFRSAFIEVRKTTENAASDGSNLVAQRFAWPTNGLLVELFNDYFRFRPPFGER